MIDQLFGKYFKIFFIASVAAIVLSWVGYNFDSVNQVAFGLVCLITLIASLKDLRYGLFIVLAELLIGSKGYLFWLELGGLKVSLRLAIFLILLAVWLIKLFKNKDFPFFRSPLLKPFSVLVFFILYGLLIGFIKENTFDNIFFDVNGYLFFGLIFIFFQVIKSDSEINKIIQILNAGLLTMVFHSLLLIYVFGHNFIYTMPSLYGWVRSFGLGEVTRITSNFFRVFSQSQIYGLLAFFIYLAFFFIAKKHEYSRRKNIGLLSVLGLSIIIIIVSFSRSFWLGLAGGIVFFLILVFRPYKLRLQIIFKKSLLALCLVVVAVGIIFGIANFPFPKPGGTTSASLIMERAIDDLTTEAGAASRWTLLPILKDKVLDSPIIGHGFGATVTYQTEDPRFLESHPDGQNTTFAFEWTYLDIWIKMGVFGLLAYLYFIYRIFKLGWSTLKQSNQDSALSFGLLSGLVALVFLNVTTPYFNHPLGIGFLCLIAATFYYLNKKIPQQS